MAVYATPADMAVRYDVRTLGDLVADDGTRVDSTAIQTNTTLEAILVDASGEFESCMLHGNRYSADDLAALDGNSLGLAKRIVCKLAMGMLWERRQYIDLEKAEEAMEAARKTMDKLRKGEYVFNITANIQAGNPEVITPTMSSISRLNLTVDRARGRNGYYPERVLPGQVSDN